MTSTKNDPVAVPDEAPAETPVEAPAKTESALRREAYSAAERRLREENKDRFDALVQEEATARGVTYQRRLTEEEKARQKLQELLAAHPGLAAEAAGTQPVA
jgi:hypothetical protein